MPSISPLLTAAEEFEESHRLKSNAGSACIGSKIYGQGFVITKEQAERFVRNNASASNIIYPYLIGQELNTNPVQAAGRLVIHFGQCSESEAKKYGDVFAHVEQTVKPERLLVKQKNARERWWQFEAIRQELYDSISGMDRVLVKALTSKHHALVFVASDLIYDQTLIIFFLTDWASFSVLQSDLHNWWALTYGPKLETRPRYTISECFETFPLPSVSTKTCYELGQEYHEHRSNVMLSNEEGLTKTYNRLHDPSEITPSIQRLRNLHVEMDRAVAAAYGWSDLELGHGFHETKQGIRFTISEAVRREVLARLLKLNHQRHAEEVAQVSHEPKAKERADALPRPKKTTKKPTAPAQHKTLFDLGEVDAAFPATDRDSRLCGLLCDLVSAIPNLASTAYLDALLIAVRPPQYGALLIDERRTQLSNFAGKFWGKNARTNDAIPWMELVQLLTQLGAIHSEEGRGLIPGSRIGEVRGAYPVCDPKLIQLLHEAAIRLRELQSPGHVVTPAESDLLSQIARDRQAQGGSIV